MTSRVPRAALLATALVLAACGDDAETEAEPATTPATTAPAPTTSPPATDAPTTTATPTTVAPTTTLAPDCPTPDGLPDLLVSEGRIVSALVDEQLTTIATLPSYVAVALPDGNGGAVVLLHSGEPAEDGSVPTELLRLDAQGRAAAIAAPQGISVFDVGPLAGRVQLLYGERAVEGGEGALVLQPLDGGGPADIGFASGPEFGTQSAQIAAGMIVASAVTDLTESVYHMDATGTRLEGRWSPTTDLAYNMPPFVRNAAPSPDGSTLVWLEGPDWDGQAGAMVPAPHRLLMADGVTGQLITSVEIPQLGTESIDITYLDFDGRFALVSHSTRDHPSLPVLAIDTLTEPPTVTELCVAGNATLADIYTG